MTRKEVILICLTALAAWGVILFNGAGWSHPDDAVVVGMSNWFTSFRTLLNFTYQLNMRLGGWMLTNLALHVIASLLVYRLTRSFVLWRTALIAACLFAAHPLAGDAVASVSGRSSILCSVFILACLVSVASWEYTRWRHAKIFGFAALAVLTKEEAIVLLILIPAVQWIQHKTSWRLWAYVMTVAAMFVPVFFRQRVIEASSLAAPDPWVTNYLTLMGDTIIKLFIPAGLSVEPSMPVSIRLISVSLVAACIMFWYRRHVAALLIGSAFLVRLMFPIALPLLEHRLYLAMAGAALVLAALLVKYSARGYWAVAVIALFIVLSNHRAYLHSTPVLLWEDALTKSPYDYRVLLNAGGARMIAGDASAALAHWQRAIEVRPGDHVLKKNISFAYIQLGDLANASRALDGF